MNDEEEKSGFWQNFKEASFNTLAAGVVAQQLMNPAATAEINLQSKEIAIEQSYSEGESNTQNNHSPENVCEADKQEYVTATPEQNPEKAEAHNEAKENFEKAEANEERVHELHHGLEEGEKNQQEIDESIKAGNNEGQDNAASLSAANDNNPSPDKTPPKAEQMAVPEPANDNVNAVSNSENNNTTPKEANAAEQAGSKAGDNENTSAIQNSFSRDKSAGQNASNSAAEENTSQIQDSYKAERGNAAEAANDNNQQQGETSNQTADNSNTQQRQYG